MERRKPKNGKPLTEYDIMYNALLEFHDHLVEVIEQTTNNSQEFTKKEIAEINKYNNKNNANHRAGRRMIRVRLEKKIKELIELHESIHKEYDDVLYVLDDFKKANKPRTPNQNAFIRDVNHLILQIHAQMEHFTTNVIDNYVNAFKDTLSKLEHKNEVDPNFTRIYPNLTNKTKKNNKNKKIVNLPIVQIPDNNEKYTPQAGVKVGNKGSFSSLRNNHNTRRSIKKYNINYINQHIISN